MEDKDDGEDNPSKTQKRGRRRLIFKFVQVVVGRKPRDLHRLWRNEDLHVRSSTEFGNAVGEKKLPLDGF